jgi:uncharacterized protein YcbK (DUF882 family)
MKTTYFYSLLCFFLVFFLCFFSCSEKEKELKPIHYIGSYNRDFNDLNEKHLEAANKIGIEPVENREAAEKLKKRLEEIKSTKNYEVDNLTHSIPFLVHEAADLLDKIGENFSDSLKNLNAPAYKIIVTSITRTKEDVKRLGSTNGNASKQSAHTYGTTFDISWKRFLKTGKSKTELTDEQLKMVLASVLRDLKKEGSCYIKHEKKQACFHITARL